MGRSVVRVATNSITRSMSGAVEISPTLRDSRWGVRALTIGMIASLTLGYLLDKYNPDPESRMLVYLFCGIGLLLGALLALSDIRVGLSVFILVGCISPRFGANFRMEDLLVPAIFLSWIGSTSRGNKFYVKTPISKAVIVTSVTILVSLSWGLAQGTIPHPQDGFFIAFKRIEYVGLFFLALNSIRSQKDGHALIMTFMLGAIIACFVAIGTAGDDPSVGDTRATGIDDNYNTFAGFVVIAVSLAVAAALHFKGKPRAIFSLLSLVLVATLLKTYSREGYFILAIALISLGLLRYRVLIPVVLLIALIGPLILPGTVLERVNNSVSQVQNYQKESSGVNSFTARVEGWTVRWHMVEQQPILGSGPGSVPLHIDNEYLVRLIESGVVGLAAFFYLLLAFWKYLRICSRKLRGTPMEPFAYGLTAAFIAMIVQGMVAAAWSTIRTMEPFWILAGALGGLVIHAGKSSNSEECAVLDRPEANLPELIAPQN